MKTALKKHKSIPFKLLKTNHIIITVKVNKIKGIFILDTGASNSCIDSSFTSYFQLNTPTGNHQTASASDHQLSASMSNNNILQLGRYKNQNFNCMVMNLETVNLALEQYQCKPVHGILGADILIESNAIINYETNELLLK